MHASTLINTCEPAMCQIIGLMRVYRWWLCGHYAAGISARICSTRLATRRWIPRTELAVVDSPHMAFLLKQA